jgi:hypothetical protein
MPWLLCSIGIHEPPEKWPEVEPFFARARAAKVVDSPDHVGGTEVEARVAVGNSFVQWVR